MIGRDAVPRTAIGKSLLLVGLAATVSGRPSLKNFVSPNKYRSRCASDIGDYWEEIRVNMLRLLTTVRVHASEFSYSTGPESCLRSLGEVTAGKVRTDLETSP